MPSEYGIMQAAFVANGAPTHPTLLQHKRGCKSRKTLDRPRLWSRPGALACRRSAALAGHDHRNVGCLYHGRCNRPEQHARAAAAAVAANDEQLCRAGLFEKVTRRVVVHDNALNRDVGIAVLPAGQSIWEDLVRPG